MLDTALLHRFKTLSREDEQIAEVIIELVSGRVIESILDVGAGPGVISRRIAAEAARAVQLHVVEPQVTYRYPATTIVHRTSWEQASLSQKFDLIVMSHVVGHLPATDRGEIVARALDHLSDRGQLIVVENAPAEPFWSLNLDIGKQQNQQYIIDFADLESAFQRRGVAIRTIDLELPLFLGPTKEEQLELMNIFFPCPFNRSNRDLVLSRWSALFEHDDGVLHLAQRFYVVEMKA